MQEENEIKYKAIPTTYNGTRFRSILESKYARLFDYYGLQWSYECLELKRYIPDFLITINDIDFLWEVKPAVQATEFKPAARKLAQSGWRGPAIISGSRLELTIVDDRPDLTLVGCLDVPNEGWSRVGRTRWPASWGTYPFEDIFSVWRGISNQAQWNP